MGRPPNPPDAAVVDNVVYVSWNGATEVKQWALFGGTDSDEFDSLASMSNITKNGFEDNFALNSSSMPNFVSVLALDSNGDELGRSGVFQVADGSQLSSGTSSYSDSSQSTTSHALRRFSIPSISLLTFAFVLPLVM